MKRRPGPRKTANLSDSIHHQLNMYALAAGAAGVGLLALPQQSEAKIVYTPIHKVIGLDGHYDLDLNHDGIVDFTIVESSTRSPRYYTNELWAKPMGINGVEGYLRNEAVAVTRGKRITGTFYQRQALMFRVRQGSQQGQTSYGPWRDVTNRYLGLRFIIKGKVHYGWARLTVKTHSHDLNIHAVLTGYAYETTPGKSIKAGQTKEALDDSTNENFVPDASLTSPVPDKQPASLGMLSLGADGVPLWRRKESLGDTQ
jgi:hypothetical protein